ncbi:hypothetical protein HS1genome_1926 [Sulfodiicoccus acidiphilus]|uniref:Uncharacterized protein n=1 Tax=Sulfodiicoccus acidiphilus TaxID=1670455 RepID=A0A348B5T5_9CREN|nr:hypothetical protein [Sulfodiicoccus acidiphilus]BBD73537.1 hypothetical protein HS1genome_1926 [Sulfodiicoccus acidiphilus]GGT92458.1 hypothetical protein GCM10007116_07750 [Sulfodiicoccus acidiphilus]
MVLYDGEVRIKGNRAAVLAQLLDPFKLAGVLGFVQLIGVYDREKKMYVSLSDSSEGVADDFRVVYCLWSPDSKPIAFAGIMKGPYLTAGATEVSGWSDDGKFNWRLTTYIREHAGEIALKVVVDVSMQGGGFDKLLARNKTDVGRIAVERLTSYFTTYFRESRGPNLTEVGKFQGSLEMALQKVREIAKQIAMGGVVVRGGDFALLVTVCDGEIRNYRLHSKGEVLNGEEVLSKLVFLEGEVEVVGLEIPLLDLLEHRKVRR